MKKCFFVGIQRELLRAPRQRHNVQNKQSIKEKVVSLPVVIHSLDLLRNDRSLLTIEQWSYLSNIINLYNTKSPVSHIRHLLEVQSSHPMKIRLKMASTNLLAVVGSMYQAILPFIENLSHFGNLSLNDRTVLIERSLKNAGGFSGILITRDADFHHSLTFKIGFPSIYGSTIMDRAVKIYEKTDNDGTLIKLLIPVLIFSSNSDLIISRKENEISKYKTNLSSDEKILIQ
jgi:hypothetical protein